MKTATFFEQLQLAISNETFVSLSLSQPKIKSQPIKSVSFRSVHIKHSIMVQGTFKLDRKQEIKNFNIGDFSTIAALLFNEHFLYAHIQTTEKEGHLLVSKRGFETVKWKMNQTQVIKNIQHDEVKNYLIPKESSFLKLLGVTSTAGNITGENTKKFRQINKYIEIFAHLLQDTFTEVPIHIVDMGCGKGYLTFAMYQYLLGIEHKDFVVTGIDIKKDVMDGCNEIARKLSYNTLSFETGTIQDTQVSSFNTLIALHACDTATDDALFKGILQKCKLILVAPCCQKQVRKSIEVNELNKSLFRYGIIKERMASDLTDLIRANILKYVGYSVQIIEFISMDDTPKNLMITAKYTGKKNTHAMDEIKEWMNLFGIKNHYLLDLLKSNRLLD